MLEVEGLRVERDGRTVVRDVAFRVGAGEAVAILGANGAGKSELVLATAGMLPVSSGDIRVDGRSIRGLRPDAIRLAGVAAVPEGHRVLGQLSVDDNLRAAASVLPTQQVAGALDEVYALFPEIAARRGQLAGNMSGGQQQMLAIGHALMARPRYLLIDEMSLGLAPLIVRRLVSTIEDLKARGMGIVIVEQFTEVALSIAETAVVMRLGGVTYAGPAQPLRDDASRLHEAYF
jgi:branched-chain amino acid transport system ATP-binding protein